MRVNKSTKGKKTKELILETAMKIASRDGLEGLSIGPLAKVVGMSKSGLFAHFNAKDNLQMMVLKMAADLFTERVLKPAFKEEKGEPRLRALFDRWIEFLNDGETLPGGSVFVAASFEYDDRPGPLRDYVQKTQKDLVSNIEKAVELAVEVGHFKKDTNAKLFAWSVYSGVLGYHHYKRLLEDPVADENIKLFLNQLIANAKVSN